MVKNLPAMWETWVRFLGWENPLQKETDTHFSILAWRIPWTEETGRLQSMGLHSHSDMTERLSLHFTGKLYIGKDSYTQMKKVSTRKNAEISTWHSQAFPLLGRLEEEGTLQKVGEGGSCSCWLGSDEVGREIRGWWLLPTGALWRQLMPSRVRRWVLEFGDESSHKYYSITVIKTILKACF